MQCTACTQAVENTRTLPNDTFNFFVLKNLYFGITYIKIRFAKGVGFDLDDF